MSGISSPGGTLTGLGTALAMSDVQGGALGAGATIDLRPAANISRAVCAAMTGNTSSAIEVWDGTNVATAGTPITGSGIGTQSIPCTDSNVGVRLHNTGVGTCTYFYIVTDLKK